MRMSATATRDVIDLRRGSPLYKDWHRTEGTPYGKVGSRCFCLTDKPEPISVHVMTALPPYPLPYCLQEQDVYSLAVTAWVILTGLDPWPAAVVATDALRDYVLAGHRPDFTALPPQTPGTLKWAIERGWAQVSSNTF